MNIPGAGRPPVVVLSFGGTGLATVRCLAKGAMPIHAAIFPSSPDGLEVRLSRHCQPVILDFAPQDEEALFRWLDGFSRSLAARPVVFPTSDATALFLARYRPKLKGVAGMWKTDHEALREIISKDRLYGVARAAGLRVPPMLVAPTRAELAAWCRHNPPPYFMKPFYGAIGDCALKRKNRTFCSEAEILDYARVTSLRNILVQRRIDAGDGRVYDAYGLCGGRGEVLALASHRRIRQYPPGTGATSLGEIPIVGDPGLEREIFHNTRELLSHLQYHGIFGVEWLHERGTGALYLADFNARPFSSIGHLADSGLNLPLLAYHELIGEAPPVALHGTLEPSRWIDFNHDVLSFHLSRQEHGQTWMDFVSSVLRCRSFAYFDAGDPAPWLRRSLDLLRMLGRATRREVARERHGSPAPAAALQDRRGEAAASSPEPARQSDQVCLAG